MPPEDVKECRICGDKRLSFVKYIHGECHHRDVPLYRCHHCCSRFSVPETFQTPSDSADEQVLDWHIRAQPYNRKKSRAIFQWIRSRAWIEEEPKAFLDIGCGIGHSLVAAEQAGYEAIGLEPESSLAAYARENQGVNVQAAFFEPDMFDGKLFDCVMLDNVLEHLSAPRQMTGDILSVLKPGGIFFLGVPPAEWIRRWLSISYMSPRRTPATDWRLYARNHPLGKFIERLDSFAFPEGHINYFSRAAIDMVASMHNAEVLESFHIRPTCARLYPWLGVTTGYYFLRKKAPPR